MAMPSEIITDNSDNVATNVLIHVYALLKNYKNLQNACICLYVHMHVPTAHNCK